MCAEGNGRFHSSCITQTIVPRLAPSDPPDPEVVSHEALNNSGERRRFHQLGRDPAPRFPAHLVTLSPTSSPPGRGLMKLRRNRVCGVALFHHQRQHFGAKRFIGGQIWVR